VHELEQLCETTLLPSCSPKVHLANASTGNSTVLQSPPYQLSIASDRPTTLSNTGNIHRAYSQQRMGSLHPTASVLGRGKPNKTCFAQACPQQARWAHHERGVRPDCEPVSTLDATNPIKALTLKQIANCGAVSLRCSSHCSPANQHALPKPPQHLQMLQLPNNIWVNLQCEDSSVGQGS
jgi:hypothetical protein